MEFPTPRYLIPIPKIHKLLLPLHDNPLINSNNLSIKLNNSNLPHGIRDLCVSDPGSLRRLPKVQSRSDPECLARLDAKTRYFLTN